MKLFTTASAVLIAFAGAASAATERGADPADQTVTATANWAQAQVTAGSIYNSHELAEAGLSADDTVTVTVATSANTVDMRGRGEL